MSNDDSKPTMADVSHTHPYTGATFGHAYRRGPVATDGGADARDTAESHPRSADEAATMDSVEHEPADGPGAKRVWVRGASDSTDDDTDARGDRVNE